MINICKSHH